MIWKYKIEKVDNISDKKKYCTALEYRQHSWQQV